MRRECKPQKADRAVRDGVRSAGIREQTAGVTANIIVSPVLSSSLNSYSSSLFRLPCSYVISFVRIECRASFF